MRVPGVSASVEGHSGYRSRRDAAEGREVPAPGPARPGDRRIPPDRRGAARGLEHDQRGRRPARPGGPDRERHRALHPHRRPLLRRGVPPAGRRRLQEDPQADARQRPRGASDGRDRRAAGPVGRREGGALARGRAPAQAGRQDRRGGDPPEARGCSIRPTSTPACRPPRPRPSWATCGAPSIGSCRLPASTRGSSRADDAIRVLGEAIELEPGNRGRPRGALAAADSSRGARARDRIRDVGRRSSRRSPPRTTPGAGATRRCRSCSGRSTRTRRTSRPAVSSCGATSDGRNSSVPAPCWTASTPTSELLMELAEINLRSRAPPGRPRRGGPPPRGGTRPSRRRDAARPAPLGDRRRGRRSSAWTWPPTRPSPSTSSRPPRRP